MNQLLKLSITGSLFLTVISWIPLLRAQVLAPQPPMGWNSWDSYGLTITEAQFRQNVNWFNEHLKSSGWKTVVIDEGWYLQRPENAANKGADQGYTMDSYGRYIPAPNRFPSGANGDGLKPLGDWVHSLGLQFGIHIIRGIPKEAVARKLKIAGSQFRADEAADTADLCRWNPDNYGIKANAAGQAYYDSLGKLYASWGIDFVKVDCIAQPYKADEIHMMARALEHSGRPIILSLSPGPTPIDEAGDLRDYAQLWRISDDFWDVWSKPKTDTQNFPQPVARQFGKLAQWSPHVETGHWPDADMLPFGYLGPTPGWGKPRHSRFTNDEARTVFTLWSIARSPLILGANLTEMDPATERLLTNSEVIEVDQHSSVNRPVIQTDTAVVWTAHGSAGQTYVAVFNIGDKPQTLSYAWDALGLANPPKTIRELWQGTELRVAPQLTTSLPPHACALYAVH